MGNNAQEYIKVYGAKVHNLKNIDVEIPRNKLTVITGLSGSGKSSLAFDTIYAEGQRRYLETFSAYARQFLGSPERPDVDKITGLSPVISIEQKTTNKNPRSTVGTVTEIYDFFRLLFARASEAFSYHTGEKMIRYTDEQIVDKILETYYNKPIIILSPLVDGRKGHYRELFEQIRKRGFIHARIDGEIVEIRPGHKLDRYKSHFIEVVVDKLIALPKDRKRLKTSMETAMKHGKGIIMLQTEDNNTVYFSRFLMCPSTGLSYNEPAPHSFSFNSPQGACPTCNGLGVINDVDIEKIIPDDSISIYDGAIKPLGAFKNMMSFWLLQALSERFKFDLKTPVKDLSDKALNAVLFGSDEPLQLNNTPLGTTSGYVIRFEGIINQIRSKLNEEESSNHKKPTQHEFNSYKTCPDCNGQRLKKESLFFRIADKNIAEVSAMDIQSLQQWVQQLPENISQRQMAIAGEIIKEISSRIRFLLDVGLDYISLSRPAKSLSGGESQRIRLATQIGSRLVNVLYILDEPSIGLHQRDNFKLIDSLKELRNRGNSVIVVEHDRDMILAADYVIDVGPGAGRKGGKIVCSGAPEIFSNACGITAEYLNGTKNIIVPELRRKGNGKFLKITGAKGNNLKNINITFPLGKFICITGVSGSGKSTLVHETLFPVLNNHFYRSNHKALPFESIIGLNNIDKLIEVDQSPIGRTPRSNASTYTGLFTDIRKLFVSLPESKIRGYKAGRFSFNVKGGRCETCQGAGMRTIEMNFLPDVYIPCETCHGKRYNRETLEVRYKGKSISDVLDMNINQATDFFKNIPQIYTKLKVLREVGMGYISLGQSSTTLSGGESQRVKLATELMKKDTGKTLYILDEPTTGLHFEDIRVLLKVLNKLTDKGNTLIVVEHNLDIIKSADYIIDLGPEGGEKGGYVVATGSPEEVAKNKNSFTAQYLRNELLL
jgi:excinuclease ABC subunit A